MEARNEKWYPVKGYEHMYEISNYGRVRQLAYSYYLNNRLIHTKPHMVHQRLHKGYLDVNLNYYGQRYLEPVNRLAAKTFIRNPKRKKYVRHLDGNKLNCRPANLKWANGYNKSIISLCDYMKFLNGEN